ncbi:hypothetical protein AVEN_49388-1 [Araneus ventricosus]|uniref:Uncharacterized protein n=1 Tax=Araneus ventricosus TaxID=182803 RepID=A0A4Y2CQD0_ARAVE|nr:hypothetical protein AVEN_49388-1 [Araneus ventricosus]
MTRTTLKLSLPSLSFPTTWAEGRLAHSDGFWVRRTSMYGGYSVESGFEPGNPQTLTGSCSCSVGSCFGAMRLTGFVLCLVCARPRLAFSSRARPRFVFGVCSWLALFRFVLG